MPEPRATVALTSEANDRKAGLTFGELRAIVTEAMRIDMPDNAKIKIGIGWSQQIQKMEIQG